MGTLFLRIFMKLHIYFPYLFSFFFYSLNVEYLLSADLFSKLIF